MKSVSVPPAETSVTHVAPAVVNKPAVVDLYASQPAAGFPAPGDDLVEAPIDLNDILIDDPVATFFVRVSGDSMEGARIFAGDVLVVDRSRTPRDGSIVVAAVYGELVVKRLRQRHGSEALVSEQVGYEPITVGETDEVFIWGVVTGVVRQLG
jgi:DNA polymerase V